MNTSRASTSLFVIACIATAIASADQPRSWVKRTFEPPPPAHAHPAIAYDTKRNVLVCFGGFTKSGLYTDDTWEWDGLVWRKVAESGPTPRAYAAAAYDEARGVTVLFGGYRVRGLGEFETFDDTWLWDGSQWKQLDVAGPSPRNDSSLTYDPVRECCVLFGGHNRSGNAYGDTWEWDGTEWKEIDVDGPDARWGHASVFDTHLNATVIGGGRGQTGYRDDLWAWDGSAWAHVGDLPSGHFERGAAAYDTQRDRLIIFRGESDGITTWEWDHEFWEWRSKQSHIGDEGSRMAYAPDRARTVIVVGEDFGPLFGATWEWDGSEWNDYNGAILPIGRTGAAMGFHERDSVASLSGGILGAPRDGARDSNIYIWNGEGWFLRRPSQRPILSYHSFVYDSAIDSFVAFGGAEFDRQYPSDTFLWDGATWTFRDDGLPDRRCESASAYDTARDRVVLFGGGTCADTDSNDQTWEWDGTRWSRIDVAGPAARRDAAMTYDSVRGVCVLFGGRDTNRRELADTWEYDGTEWRKISVDGPSARFGARMSFDSRSNRAILVAGFGKSGSNSKALSDMWSWDGSTWSKLTDGPFEARLRHALTYDPIRDAIILFGGTRNAARDEPIRDCWEYAPDPLPGDANCDAAIDFDDIDFFVAALANDFSGYLRAGGLRSCWARRAAWGDFSHDGEVNFADIDGFVNSIIAR